MSDERLDVLSLIRQFEVQSEVDSKTKAHNLAVMQETSKKISLHQYSHSTHPRNSFRALKIEVHPSIASTTKQVQFRNSDLTFHDRNIALHSNNLFSSVVTDAKTYNPFKIAKANLNTHHIDSTHEESAKVLIFTIPFLEMKELIGLQKALNASYKSKCAKKIKKQIHYLAYYVKHLIRYRDSQPVREISIGSTMLASSSICPETHFSTSKCKPPPVHTTSSLNKMWIGLFLT
eukprot:TRINITY_DN15674_c0_g1_i16.p1 TRINITY_DN15674_c0_g1~~TRINITY_DN15674_c0_g1_i16.p1  ORF type:complete len:233 (-),score=13.65 TRINITY_DN15674_c0_g1_i16:1103-1801(-)